MNCHVLLVLIICAFDFGKTDPCPFNANCTCTDNNSHVYCDWNSTMFPVFSVYNATPINYIQFTLSCRNTTTTFDIPTNAIFNLHSVADSLQIDFVNSVKNSTISPQVNMLAGALNNLNNVTYYGVAFQYLWVPYLLEDSFKQYYIENLYFEYCSVDLIGNLAFQGLTTSYFVFVNTTINNIHHNGFVGINFTGIHEISITRSGISSILPFKHTSNAITILLQFNQIENISDFSFCLCNTLNTCNNSNVDAILLPFNNISFVSTLAFANLPNLNEIDLSYNMIQSIDFSCIFSSYIKNYLHLSHNILVDFSISAVPNNSIINLQYLYLDNNRLISVPTKSLQSLYVIVYLDLSYNKIEYVAPNSFFNCSHLQFLSLDSNPILVIEPGAFNGLDIGSFTLSNLKYLSTVDLLIYYGMESISTAELSHVGIQSAYILDVAKIPSSLCSISFTYVGPFTQLDSSLESWLKIRPTNVYSFHDNTNIICTSDVQWMAKYVMCNPIQITLTNTFCQNGTSVSSYLETFQPVC